MKVGRVTVWSNCRGEIEKWLSRFGLAVLLVIVYSAAATAQSVSAAEPQPTTVHVDATPGHAINSFDPDSALGSSIDVLSHDGIDKVYTPHIIQESLSAGWGPITYRNNSELRMAAWHWTENGTWSDPAHKSGYFTGSTELKEPLATFFPMRCRIAVSRPAATARCKVRISVIGRVIRISPASSLGRAMPCIRNGWSWICRPKSR